MYTVQTTCYDADLEGLDLEESLQLEVAEFESLQDARDHARIEARRTDAVRVLVLDDCGRAVTRGATVNHFGE